MRATMLPHMGPSVPVEPLHIDAPGVLWGSTTSLAGAALLGALPLAVLVVAGRAMPKLQAGRPVSEVPVQIVAERPVAVSGGGAAGAPAAGAGAAGAPVVVVVLPVPLVLVPVPVWAAGVVVLGPDVGVVGVCALAVPTVTLASKPSATDRGASGRRTVKPSRNARTSGLFGAAFFLPAGTAPRRLHKVAER